MVIGLSTSLRNDLNRVAGMVRGLGVRVFPYLGFNQHEKKYLGHQGVNKRLENIG